MLYARDDTNYLRREVHPRPVSTDIPSTTEAPATTTPETLPVAEETTSATETEVTTTEAGLAPTPTEASGTVSL